MHTFRFYLLLRYRFLHPVFNWLWNRTKRKIIEGISVGDARAIKQAGHHPRTVTGGFQTASYIRKVLDEGLRRRSRLARPLVANPDLPQVFAAGRRPARPSRAPTAIAA